MDVIIRDQHMKNRCKILFIMCSISSYCWYKYEFLTNISPNFLDIFYQNYILFVLYLLWDTYMMCLSKNKKNLFRLDLFIHHIVGLICCILGYYEIIYANHTIIMECISLMNYTLKNNFYMLNIYRTLSILLVRLPICSYTFYIIFYGHIEFLKKETHKNILFLISIFFMIYDFYNLTMIYRLVNKKLK
jgi:hypothetical protein